MPSRATISAFFFLSPDGPRTAVKLKPPPGAAIGAGELKILRRSRILTPIAIAVILPFLQFLEVAAGTVEDLANVLLLLYLKI